MVQAWKQIAVATADGNSQTMNTGTISPTYTNLQIIIHTLGGGGSSDDGLLRFNDDTGSNYKRNFSQNGGAQDTVSSGGSTGISNMVARANRQSYSVSTVSNLNGAEKCGFGLAVTDGGSTGTGNAVTRMEYAFKWANTTQITSVQLYNTGGNWTSGSKMLVYGNVDDATTYTYPNLPNGAIFEDTTDGNHYMWNGTDTWNEVT